MSVVAGCGQCVYWSRNRKGAGNSRLGSCRRFPQFVTRHEGEWCGEYEGGKWFRALPPSTQSYRPPYTVEEKTDG